MAELLHLKSATSAAESVGPPEPPAGYAHQQTTPNSLDGQATRYALVAVLVAFVYTAFFWTLLQAGHLGHSERTIVAFFATWGAGFAVALAALTPQLPLKVSPAQFKLALAIWCNVGIVATAVLLGGPSRMLLLAGVVFGVVFGALQLSRERLRLIVAVTVATYVLALVVAADAGPLEADFEWLSILTFGTILLSAYFVGREVIALREVAVARQTELAHALARVEELALRDELTGLYNRRHLLDFLRQQLGVRSRGGGSFILCYCDLDYFKRVNDRFGHTCGDQLLRAFAQVARATVRTQDLVARLGGEEFVLVLTACKLAEAEVIVERLRRRTAQIQVHASAPDYAVTLSVGVVASEAGDTVQDLLRLADRAAYLAKARGRDCLVVAQREPVDS